MVKEHQIILNEDNGWCIKTDNAQKTSRSFTRKQDAVCYAREVSKN